MRHLFDQYDEPENRLTHALLYCLKEDPNLLRSFVRWTTGDKPPARRLLEIVEQTLPGEPEMSEEESERRGLPDMWIHDNDKWALIIENKVKSPVSADQIRRHCATALRRGFEDVSVLVMSPELPASQSLAGAEHVAWPDLYTWLKRQGNRSEWARRMASYMETAETRMTTSGYLAKGSLTTFSGIHFDSDTPYNYGEAKRLLRLAMEQLRKNKKLHKLGMDPFGEGRPAITGREGAAVWDFLPLKQAKSARYFTEYPHLTLSIQSKRVLVMVTIPSGIKPEFRRNLLELERAGFEHLILGVAADLKQLFRKAKGAKPWMDICQRHYPSQRSAPIEDARLEFDLRTAIPRKKKAGKRKRPVKPQPQWLTATYEALVDKHSNLQIGVGAVFPYSCKVLHSREALKYIAGTWLACEPIVRGALGARFRRS